MPEKAFFTSIARTDVAGIAEYIAANNLAAADRFYDTLQKKCDEISRMPQMGKLRNELSPAVRSFPFGKYVIFYIVQDDKTIILRVLHGARDISTLF